MPDTKITSVSHTLGSDGVYSLSVLVEAPPERLSTMTGVVVPVPITETQPVTETQITIDPDSGEEKSEDVTSDQEVIIGYNTQVTLAWAPPVDDDGQPADIPLDDQLATQLTETGLLIRAALDATAAPAEDPPELTVPGTEL
jgi:hypothetical protein